MAVGKILYVALVLLSPVYSSAVSLDYFRSAYCDFRSPTFFIDRYTPDTSFLEDKICHQAPARTMAMKMINEIDPRCFVLAHTDYSCDNIIAAVPASGKCLAATKARIGSWRAICNTTTVETEMENPMISYVPSELKRRSIADLPRIRQRISNVNTTTVTAPCTSSTNQRNHTVVASLVASQISAGVSASDTNTTIMTTTSPSPGAQLSSVIGAGSTLDSNLTAYIKMTGNASTMYPTASKPIMTQNTTMSTATSSGVYGRNGTAMPHFGGAVASTEMMFGDGKMSAIMVGVMASLLGAFFL